MPNIHDYLSWRGDLTFAASPLTPVDNLIFSLLAYLDMSGSFSDTAGADAAGSGEDAGAGSIDKGNSSGAAKQRIPLKEIVKKFFKTHDAQEIKKAVPPFNEVPELARRAMETVRFGSILVSDYVNVVDHTAGEQMAAMVFWIDDDCAYAAFRGTDNTITGWKEDFSLSYLKETPGQRRAVEFLNRAFSDNHARFYVGGHSKGGNLAVYSAAFADLRLRRRMVRVFSNDGPGFRKEITGTFGYRSVMTKVIRIVPESSVIGGLLETRAKTRFIKSSAMGILQHNAFTWQVMGADFLVAKRSDAGRFFDRSVRNWIEGLSDDDRERFTDALFRLLESGGAKTVEELRDTPAKTIRDIVNASWQMNHEQMKTFTDMLWKLVQSGVNTAIAGSGTPGTGQN